MISAVKKLSLSINVDFELKAVAVTCAQVFLVLFPTALSYHCRLNTVLYQFKFNVLTCRIEYFPGMCLASVPFLVPVRASFPCCGRGHRLRATPSRPSQLGLPLAAACNESEPEEMGLPPVGNSSERTLFDGRPATSPVSRGRACTRCPASSEQVVLCLPLSDERCHSGAVCHL